MKTIIITDSAADIELDEAQALDIKIVPIYIEIEGKSYRDLYDISKKDFYEKLATIKSFPKTSQPTPECFIPYFEDAKANGDCVIAILLSSSLSGTIQSALIAKNTVEYDNIHIIDSMSAVSAEGLLVRTAVKRRDEGKDAKAIIEEIAYMIEHMKVFAMVDTLEYLHRGGRLTKTQARIGSLLNLKPLLTINKEGKLEVFSKCLGRARAYAQILDKINKTPIDDRYPVCFTYSYDDENCLKLLAKVTTKYPVDYIKPIPMIGSTVGTHVGPNAFGIIYIAKPLNSQCNKKTFVLKYKCCGRGETGRHV